MDKCLVLGGNGFIGSAIVKRLVADGVPTRIMDRSYPNSKSLGDVIDKVEYIEKDFFNDKALGSVFDGVKNIFHCITSTYPSEANQNPVYDVETNIIGTIKLLEHLKPHYPNIRLFFLSSGGAIYGNTEQLPIGESHTTEPISSYGISKLTIEKHLHMHKVLFGLDYLIFRISNPYGETQDPKTGLGTIVTFLHRVLNNETIEIWGDGGNVRDYIYINDVGDALVKAADILQLPHSIYNIGSGDGKSVNDILGIIKDITGKKPKVKYVDKRSFDIRANYLDVSRAKQDFGWEPTTNLMDGVDKIWKHMLNRKSNGQ
jgi:UDP-glucose 4-epimerase